MFTLTVRVSLSNQLLLTFDGFTNTQPAKVTAFASQALLDRVSLGSGCLHCVSAPALAAEAERYQLSSQLTPPLSLSTTLLSQQLAPCLVLLCLSSWGKQTWCWYQRAISEIWHNYTHHQCTSHRTLLSPNKAGWQGLSLANMAPSPVLSPL